jgi:multidrug efflux pump
LISRFFIQRPIFAWVIAIAISLFGAASIFSLPIAQYPDIAPPSVSVSAFYPGASAETLETSVTQVIEQQLTGIDGMIYFSSNNNASGSARITITFEKGTDPDVAQVQVQNKVQQALSRLPQQVQQQGLTVTKAQSDFLLIVAVYDESDRSSRTDIADYLVSRFQDPLSRVDGVGETRVFGSQYAMRIWLDPFKLASFKLMPTDIANAIRAQNVEVSAGQIGALPAPPGQRLNATVTAKSRLETPEQFRKILVKTESDGSIVRLSDVAEVELGDESYGVSVRLNRHPGSGVAISLAPGADALETADAVKSKVEELARDLPPGYVIAFPRDTTDFIRLSIYEVVETLVVAVILVVIVMFLFLQSWRATLIPAIAVPVVLLGTFGVLALFGYSINTLTLFGMVLAIGLLVDDAIVVVENVERIMSEEGLGPRQATIKSMGEVSGALIGIGLVLSAVLLPMAFFGGSTGVIYRQFSITIVSAMILSVIVALILSPALCASLLKPGDHAGRASGGFLAAFNRGFDRLTRRYVGGVRRVVRWWVVSLVVYAGVGAALWLTFIRLPTGFLPMEDQGQAMVVFTLPTGATSERTEEVAREVEDYLLGPEKDNVGALFAINGFSFAGVGQNTGMAFVSLEPWAEREGEENTAQAIAGRTTANLARFRDAQVFALTPGSIRGLGRTGGFTFQLLNVGGLSRARFTELRDQLIAAANQDPRLRSVRASILEDTPQLKIDIDDEKLAVLGLSEDDVLRTLSIAWGGTYVNDFIDRGRVKRVFLQGGARYRASPDDLDSWFVRSRTGEMTPFAAFTSDRWEVGPSAVTRFNGVPSFEIQGEAAEGVSSGDAMAGMVELQRQLAPGTGYAWSELSYEEQLSSGRAPLLYAVSILVVFLCLAALYESWSIPMAVLLVIPLGVIGAVLAVTLRGLDNNIFFQVGLLTTMGLTAKNAILIVEFAEIAHRSGKPAVASALQAARIRLRPIIMTSAAFIAGVLPLAVATGAGAQSRLAIGTAVAGGTLTGTLLAIFFVPLFFVLLARLVGSDRAANPATEETP